jgi:hypothetical protein
MDFYNNVKYLIAFCVYMYAFTAQYFVYAYFQICSIVILICYINHVQVYLLRVWFTFNVEVIMDDTDII